MKPELTFREVDLGFYVGFIEAFEKQPGSPVETFIRKEVLSQDSSCSEYWCICDPNESFHEIPSGLFDTYINLEKDLNNMKFLGSFRTLKQAEEYLNQLFRQGYKFESAPAIESDYYHTDYSDKKQSIFI